MGDAQVIIGEDAAAAFGLGRTVRGEVAPAGDGLFIFEKGERQELVGVGEALEPFDGEEAFDLIHHGPHGGGDVEVFGLAVRVRHDFENDGDHVGSPWGAEARVSQVRSSRKMNFSDCAKA